MYEFTLPDYKGGSIVNLMSSITRSFNKKHDYNELPHLTSKQLKKYDNIVLIIIDGLGFNHLNKHKDSFMYLNLKRSITSVFLPTTACANTVFLTGYPAQQHALTGWDINLKEIGTVATILRFRPMFGGNLFTDSNVYAQNILDIPQLHKGFNGESYIVIDKDIATSPFNKYVSSFAKIIPINNYKTTFKVLTKLINKKSKKRKFIHAYLPELDHLAHMNGIKSNEVKNILYDFDKRIKKLASSIRNTNSLIVITADHGFIDSPKKTQLWIEDFKGLKECLTVPLSGEPRTRNCYVRPSKVKDFEEIIKYQLSPFCWSYKGEQLIEDNLFGLGAPNKRLFDRVGDYVLIMKDNYTLKEKLANYDKNSKFHIGKHGGVSNDEMLVPLILIESKP